MIPLRDNIASSTTPWVTYLMVGLCTGVFLLQLGDEFLIERFGMIPARVSQPDAVVGIPTAEVMTHPSGQRYVVQGVRKAADSGVHPLLTLLTCVFLHGGLMHFLGNMWFLWIFGDNVEDRLGHVRYLLFYLGCGVAASLAHYWSGPNSPIPTIGASGAIAGVMGAYLIFFPGARVLTLVPILFILQLLVVPAGLFLGLWFLLQFFQGTMSIGAGESTGVAWWAHIGGFAVGAVVAWIVKQREPKSPRFEEVASRRIGYSKRSGW